MLIKLTEDHIRNGKRSDPWACPIALSLEEKLGHNNIYIGRTRLRIGYDYYDYSLRVERWISSFDLADQRRNLEPRVLNLKDKKLSFSNKRNFE